MQLHRLAFLFGTSTLLLLGAYACSSSSSSDDDNNTTTPDADAGADTGSTETTDSGSTETTDSGSTETTDSGTEETDAGDAAVPDTCVGNPLSADGGTAVIAADGGANQVGALFTVVSSVNFGYGPQYVDELGGRLLFSAIDDHVVNSAGPDGGGVIGDPLLSVPATVNPNGSDYYNGSVYTLTANQDVGGGAIYRIPLEGGTAAVAATLPATAVVSPNNLVVTKNGTVYFTDPAFQSEPTGALTTAVRKMYIDGGALSVVAADHTPVGIALNKDQTKLYVSYNDTATVSSWTLDPTTGAVTGGPASFSTNSSYAPSGVAVDQGGNVWVVGQGADNNGIVEVFNADGSKRWATIYITQAKPNGIAFGGTNRTKVFITTEAGNTTPVYSLDTRCPGVQ